MFLKNKNLYFLIFFLFLLVLLNFNEAFASTLNFSPSTGTYRVGDTIKIKVNVNSLDKSINAISTKVSFSNNLLTLSSVSKSSSIISLWPHEALFSNADGTASFEGVILNGYTGSSGNVATLVFKAKAVGVANFKFLEASILANDGNGTETFTGPLSTGTLNIEKAIKIEKEEKEPIIETIPVVVEKIKEVEVSNNLPNNSLLITIIIVLVIIFNLTIIFVFWLLAKLKKRFKNKLLKAEKDIYLDFKDLEKNINKKETEKTQNNVNLDNKKSDIIEEVIETEAKVIKEIEKVEEEI